MLGKLFYVSVPRFPLIANKDGHSVPLRLEYDSLTGVPVVSHSIPSAAGLPHHSHLLEQNHNELSMDFPAASGTRKLESHRRQLLTRIPHKR